MILLVGHPGWSTGEAGFGFAVANVASTRWLGLMPEKHAVGYIGQRLYDALRCGDWNEQTWQTQIRDIKALKEEARPPLAEALSRYFKMQTRPHDPAILLACGFGVGAASWPASPEAADEPRPYVNHTAIFLALQTGPLYAADVKENRDV